MSTTRPAATWPYELLLVLMTILWGSTFVAQQIGIDRGLPPMTFNALRFALGSLSLVPVVWLRRKRGYTQPGSSRQLRGATLAGLFLFGAAGAQQAGLAFTSTANAGFITSFYILFVPLIGLIVGQRAPRGLWTGVATCLAGLYLLSISSGYQMAAGDAIVLISALLWAGQIMTIDAIAKTGDPLEISLLQFVVCALLSGLAGLLFERCPLQTIINGAGPIVYAGIVSVGIAFTIQVICQKRCPAGKAAVIMSLEAVFAALAAYLVLDERLTMRSLIGCALILVGILIVQLMPARRITSASSSPSS